MINAYAPGAKRSNVKEYYW